MLASLLGEGEGFEVLELVETNLNLIDFKRLMEKGLGLR